MVEKRPATPCSPTKPLAILLTPGQSSWTPLACLFALSHTADHTPEPPPTSSQRTCPAFSRPSFSAASCATGKDIVAMAGTRIFQNTLSGCSEVAEPVGAPLFTAAGSVDQSTREAVITS